MRFGKLGGVRRALVAGAILSVSSLSVSSATAQPPTAQLPLTTEPRPAEGDDACASEARNSELLDREFSLAAEAGGTDVGHKLRFKLLAQNRLLRCRLDAHSEFLRATARLVGVAAESFRPVLEKVRWLTRLRDELEKSAQRVAPGAEHATIDANSLLDELTQLRIERIERARELATLRARLAAREATLTRAMVEVKRTLAYQAQVKELQKKLASGGPGPGAQQPAQPTPEPDRETNAAPHP